jgi:high-affinity iron transporter
MTGQTFNIAFVIWRESIEALLVVGILNAWLTHRPEAERRAGRAWLWAGVAAGLVGAVALAYALLKLGDTFGDEAQEYFQTAVVLIAAGLIVQMVVWMRRHGRTLKSDLHRSLTSAAEGSNWFGVFALAAVAVMREGGEAAVFLYGALAAGDAFNLAGAGAAALGFAAAAATYALLQAGSRILSWRTFFRATEIMLLLLAGALLLTGVDHLISLGFVPALSQRLWDTSHLLPDSGAIGGLISGFTGYRAKPALTELLVYGAYWSIILWMLYRPRSNAPA